MTGLSYAKWAQWKSFLSLQKAALELIRIFLKLMEDKEQAANIVLHTLKMYYICHSQVWSSSPQGSEAGLQHFIEGAKEKNLTITTSST